MTRHTNTQDEERRDLAYELSDWERYSWRAFLRDMGVVDPSSMSDWETRSRGAWPLLAREVFGRILTNDDLDPMDEPVKWAEDLHGQAQDLREWRALCDTCLADRLAAGVAALAIVRQLQEDLGDDFPEKHGGEGGADDTQQGSQAGAAGPEGQPGGGGSPGQQEGDSGGLSEDEGASIRAALRKACAESVQRTEEQREAMRVLGGGWGTESADPGTTRDRTLKLAKTLGDNPDLVRLARMAGRMLATLRQKRAGRLRGRPSELADVTLGGEVERILPVELAMLRRRATRLDLIRRIAERRALVYELKGRERAERGPMVVCVDTSGSMQGPQILWAKAMAVALAGMARDQNRDYLLLGFNSRVHTQVGKEKGAQGLVDFASIGASGGTSWEDPLGKAMVHIDTAPDFAQADVLVLTDGDCNVSADFAASFGDWTRQKEVNVIGVLIPPAGDHQREVVKRWATHVMVAGAGDEDDTAQILNLCAEVM